MQGDDAKQDRDGTDDVPRLDGFTIVRQLGHGGMATVWEARQHDPPRTVAIKLLNSDFAENPEDVENFYGEAKRAAELDHENIVTVFEVGCQKGRYYYVMELAAGYDTRTWMLRKGRLGEGDALTIAESVAVALDYAFKTIGIVHCDIKPANIMVDGDGTVRLTDLGIAKVVRGTRQDDGYVSGTPAFMSPEQVRGDDLDVRADIYSLGATIYTLVTGRRLFEGKKDAEAMQAQCTEQVDDLRCLNPDISYPFAVLVSQMLAKDKVNRPMSWSVVMRDIQRVRQGQLPLGSVSEDAISTMRLDPPPPALEQEEQPAQESHPPARPSRRDFWRNFIWIAATVVAAVASFAIALVVTTRAIASSSPVAP